MQPAEEQINSLDKNDYLARNQLITQYLPEVKRIVHKIAIYLPPSVDIDDLLNVGVIGLIQAMERYDPARDNKFMTYATFRIRGAVLSELRSRDHISRSNRKKVREMEKTYLKLEQKLGRDVEDVEVAEKLGITIDQFYRIKQISNISFISLEEMGFFSNREKETLVSYFIKSDEEDILSLTGIKELKAAVARAIEKLPEKERMVISLYYMDELTMKETGRVLGITESRVSQLHSQAVIHIREKLRKIKLL